ncbi:MAG: alkaline phosphatase family protein, partial [Halobacteriota archaeon]
MEPDRLQHLVWDESILLEHYRQLDDILGDVLDRAASADANLFVVSDHGFGPVRTAVRTNAVLRDAGYLTTRAGTGTRGVLERVGITKSTLGSTLEKVGVDQRTLVETVVPRRVVDELAVRVPGTQSMYDVDFSRTRAFVRGYGNVYVNDAVRFDRGTVHPESIPDIKAQLTRLFEALTDPSTGRQVLSVADGDDIFPNDSKSPDLVLEASPEYAVSTRLTGEWFAKSKAEASHRKDGILLAIGPDVASGATLDAQVVDIAPTVLHALGRPVPEYVDGEVLWELFDPDSLPANRPVQTTEDTGERRRRNRSPELDADLGKVKERLQGLGYMEEG